LDVALGAISSTDAKTLLGAVASLRALIERLSAPTA
jgi:hypothetical protein